MNAPLVSIVLPTYNGARFLAESIQSCIAQTFKQWELIIVDDCSTDETPDIIADYVSRDPRIRAIRHTSNRKLPGALNTGFAAARGGYYTWTSDDNAYDPAAIARMLEFLQQHPTVGVVYCDFRKLDIGTGVLTSHVVSPPSELAVGNCIGPCMLYRRDVALRIGRYAEHLFLVEDYEFWLRASRLTALVPLHEDLYLYRLHDNTLTVTRQVAVRRLVTRIQSEYLPKMDWLPRAARARGYVKLYLDHSWSVAPLMKTNYFLMAVRYSPVVVFHLLFSGRAKRSLGRFRRRLMGGAGVAP
jgi:glycosyltransferase involved in cell wall biosynthesis